ncbi:MAG TPA: tyrosine-type recombinase/integrase [Pyrinomonadaceae bacterium]|nr:tyrosine-type recombinase/integrase [Pyrinomonadaceae bacterium]
MTKQRKDELPEGVIRSRGKLFARITYYDDNKKRRQKWRQAENVTEAKRLRRELLNELENHGSRTVDATRRTFEHLAKHFESNYLVEAEYRDDRKVRGRRSVETPRLQLRVLRDFFENRRLRSVTYADLLRFRAERLRTPTRGDKARYITQYQKAVIDETALPVKISTRAIASVNRELALLRKMFNVALQEGWILKNPFHMGESLISAADERKRERILTREEEERLLAACGERTVVYMRNGKQITALRDAGTKQREHLRSLIIMAIDTGCRLGEMLTLRWSDVDLTNRLITLRAFNTKTMREREVSITIRLQQELERLWESSFQVSDEFVFGMASIKKSFTSVRKLAGLDDVRFHDLRHTHGTRLDDLGFSLAKIGAQLGHTQTLSAAL